MSRKPEHYIRTTHGLTRDPDFLPIFRDGALYGAFQQLSMIADDAWPLAVTPPRWVNATAVRRLVAAGWVQPVTDGEVRVPVIDRERGYRHALAQRAADARWNPADDADADADAYAEPMPPLSLALSP